MAEHRKNAGEPPAGDYPVGYKRTPAKNRFPPGQSGNPSGRPRNVKPEKDVIETLLRKRFEVGDQSLTGRDLIIQRLFKAAANGEVGLSRLFYERMDATGAGRDDALPELTATDREILADLQARLGAAAATRKTDEDNKDEDEDDGTA